MSGLQEAYWKLLRVSPGPHKYLCGDELTNKTVTTVNIIVACPCVAECLATFAVSWASITAAHFCLRSKSPCIYVRVSTIGKLK